MTRAAKRVRAWILAAGVAGLCAGTALGWAAPTAARSWSDQDLNDRNAGIVKNFTEKYGLTREQQRLISMVLRRRDEQTLQRYRNHGGSLPATLSSQIESLRRQADERIYAVLTEDQRTGYLKDLRIETPK